MSKYLNIANEIESNIIKQRYKGKLPRQEELAKYFNTSRVTIINAIKILSDKNLVRTVKGHGTYIVKQEIPKVLLDGDARDHSGMWRDTQGKGRLVSKIISFDIRDAESGECAILHLPESAQVYDIIRLRILNDEPFKLEYTVMPVSLIPGITEDVLHKSIYKYIQENLHLTLGKANRFISADRIDAYDVKYLDCQKGDAVLSVKQVAFLEDGRAFEYSETRNRYDRGSLNLIGVKSEI